MRNGLTAEQRLRLYALDAQIAQLFKDMDAVPVYRTVLEPLVPPEIAERKASMGANAWTVTCCCSRS